MCRELTYQVVNCTSVATFSHLLIFHCLDVLLSLWPAPKSQDKSITLPPCTILMNDERSIGIHLRVKYFDYVQPCPMTQLLVRGRIVGTLAWYKEFYSAALTFV